MNDDLISRKAAIRETWREPTYSDPLNVMTEMRDRLEALPSAQPERKVGKTLAEEVERIKREITDIFAEQMDVQPSAQPNLQPTCNQLATDCISILSEIRSGYSCFDSERPYYHALSEGIKALSQPERKTGGWILMSDADGEYYACSICGDELPRYSTEVPTWDKPYPHKQSIDKTDYCPNCGAKMKMEDSE